MFSNAYDLAIRNTGRWSGVLVVAAAALTVAAIGGGLSKLGPWYEALVKPSWQPADAVFPIAWTLIFSLTAAAGLIAWRAAHNRQQRVGLIALFGVNALLNVAWSALFFTIQRPDWALIEVWLLLASIVALIVATFRLSIVASALLLPYLLWVIFAAVLNVEIIRLNGY